MFEYAHVNDNDRYDDVDDDSNNLSYLQKFKRSIIRDLDRYAAKLHISRMYIILLIFIVILLIVIFDIRWSMKKGLTSNIVVQKGGFVGYGGIDLFGNEEVEKQIEKKQENKKSIKDAMSSGMTRKAATAAVKANREQKDRMSSLSFGEFSFNPKTDSKPATPNNKPATSNNATPSKKLEIDKDKGVEDPAALTKKEGWSKKQLKKGSEKLGSWKNDFMANFKSGPMQNISNILGTSLSSAFWFVGFIFTALGFISLPFIIVVAMTYTVLKYLLSFFSGL